VGLVAVAVERSTPSVLPAEVVHGVELLKVYNVDGMRMYAFRVSEEGVHYYFAVKTEKEWRVAGGKYNGRQVQIYGKAARAVADAINALYREKGVDRRVEVKQMRDGTPYIKLTNVDLKLLNINIDVLTESGEKTPMLKIQVDPTVPYTVSTTRSSRRSL